MSELRQIVSAEIAGPVDPRVSSVAAAIAGRYRGAARAVLFYGACLRTGLLEGQMLDFYVIVSDYGAAYGRSWLAPANKLIPPNVFHLQHQGLAAKYAVLSEADFHRESGPEASTVSVWARFAQPSRLAWAYDEAARENVTDSICRAAPTLIAYARPMVGERETDDVLAIWRRGFELTYACELRAEREGRGGAIVDCDPERYRRLGEAALAAAPPIAAKPAERAWRRLKRNGKLLSVLRLVKAGGTFSGGIDYLAWKIARHSGTEIRIRPWQRRWPLVAAITLLPRLLRRGAIR